jgi:hypothetical protein
MGIGAAPGSEGDSEQTIVISVQNNRIVGTAKGFSSKYDQFDHSYRGQVDPSGAVTLGEATNGLKPLSGRINGRQMTVNGWNGARTCKYALDQVGTP